jgi:hypothetical protein
VTVELTYSNGWTDSGLEQSSILVNGYSLSGVGAGDYSLVVKNVYRDMKGNDYVVVESTDIYSEDISFVGSTTGEIDPTSETYDN